MPAQATYPLCTLRVGIALSLAGAFGIFAFTATVGLIDSMLAAATIAVAVAACVVWLFVRFSTLPRRRFSGLSLSGIH